VSMDNTVEKLQDWDMYLEAIEQDLKAGYIEEKLFVVYLRKDGMNKQSDGSWADIIRERRGTKKCIMIGVQIGKKLKTER